MSQQHTPEPWRKNSQGDSEYIYSETHGAVANIPHGGIHRDEHKANAARIVACVNAMAGIEDPQNLRDTWEAIKHLELDAYYKAEEKISKLEKKLKYKDKQLENILKITDLQLEKLKVLETLISQIDDYLNEAAMITKGDSIHQLIKKAESIKEGGKK